MFEPLISEDAVSTPAEQNLLNRATASQSLEELVLLALSEYASVQIGQIDPTLSELIGCRVQRKAEFLYKNAPIDLTFIARRQDFRTKHKIALVSEALQNLSDSSGVVLDEEWLSKRDKDLKVRVDRWEQQVVAPANSLVPLVLSYVLAPGGFAVIKRDLAELQSHALTEIAKLELSLELPGTDKTLEERIGVRLDLLQRKLKIDRSSLTPYGNIRSIGGPLI